jgi:RES domain-containing protein
VRVSRLVWRHVPAGAEPLHLGWMQRARGRWNTQRPRLTCLYTAYSAEGALAEFEKLAVDTVFARAPRDLVSIRVTVEPVVDLTEAVVQALFDITLTQMAGSDSTDLAACRRAAQTALASGYRAIRAPSAAAPGERNLMIYPESAAGRLVLENGPDRRPINHGEPTLRTRPRRLDQA